MEQKDGYQHGLNPGLEVLRKAKEYGVAEITYYGFTVDNCKRPKVQQNAFKKACVDAVRLIKKKGMYRSWLWEIRAQYIFRKNF